jgi:hypothetical protein
MCHSHAARPDTPPSHPGCTTPRRSATLTHDLDHPRQPRRRPARHHLDLRPCRAHRHSQLRVRPSGPGRNGSPPRRRARQGLPLSGRRAAEHSRWLHLCPYLPRTPGLPVLGRGLDLHRARPPRRRHRPSALVGAAAALRGTRPAPGHRGHRRFGHRGQCPPARTLRLHPRRRPAKCRLETRTLARFDLHGPRPRPWRRRPPR